MNRRDQMAATLACGLAGDVIRTLREIRLCVFGASMVSCTDSSERPCANRGESLLTTRGDRLLHNDPPVSSIELLGRVISIERGDFRAEFNPATARGRIEQTFNPFSLDSVLRIVHTLLLAKMRGFPVHASSAIRNGQAVLFPGVSGAGKTAMARLAPPDAALLTDEISYVIPREGGSFAVGTPFFGERARAGENLRAPLHACTFLPRVRRTKLSRSWERKRFAPCLGIFFSLPAILNLSNWRSLLRSILPGACLSGGRRSRPMHAYGS